MFTRTFNPHLLETIHTNNAKEWKRYMREASLMRETVLYKLFSIRNTRKSSEATFIKLSLRQHSPAARTQLNSFLIAFLSHSHQFRFIHAFWRELTSKTKVETINKNKLGGCWYNSAAVVKKLIWSSTRKALQKASQKLSKKFSQSFLKKRRKYSKNSHQGVPSCTSLHPAIREVSFVCNIFLWENKRSCNLLINDIFT